MPRSIDQIMNEMNDQARAQGRFLGKALWEVPPTPGSILDVPVTPEAQQRLTALRELRLERKRAAAQRSETIGQMLVKVKGKAQVKLHEESQKLPPNP